MGGASELLGEDLRVVGRNGDALVVAIEHQARIADEKLLKRVVVRDHDGESVSLPAPRTTCLLPKAGDGSRIAVHHDGVEGADVDAEFHRVCRGKPEQFAFEESLLNLTAFLWGVSGA